MENLGPWEKELIFHKQLIGEYLKYGSVDKVFELHNYELPISYPGFQRLVEKWGIVKSAGPNSLLAEALCFIVLLSQKRVSLEKLYKTMPPSFKTSLGTMHRIVHNIKEGAIRRVGTALVITPKENNGQILVAEDISTPRLELGKPSGATSLPMCFSKTNEDPSISIRRVLQQEVFTQETINRQFPTGIIPPNLTPFMYLKIADVQVAVFHLQLPDSLQKFSSFKLINHRFENLDTLIGHDENQNYRAGIREIALGYQKSYTSEPFWQTSSVNLELALATLAS